MSITIKEFNEGNFTVMGAKSLKILEYFRANKDKAFTSKEIAEFMDRSQPSVTPTMKKLAKDGLLDVKRPYYALSKSDKSAPMKVIKEKPQEKMQEETQEETPGTQ